MIIKKSLILFLSLILCSGVYLIAAHAQTSAPSTPSTNSGQASSGPASVGIYQFVNLDATQTVPVDNQLSLTFGANSFAATGTLYTSQSIAADGPSGWQPLSQNAYNILLPAGFSVSSTYQLQFLTASLPTGQAGTSNFYRQVFYNSDSNGNWQILPTTASVDGQLITASASSSLSSVMLMENPKLRLSGKASWYVFKNGLFAASPEFPKGTILRVTNVDNDKTVDITVNDFGPNQNQFPDRILDLDKVAFAAIADPSVGGIDITIKPLWVPITADMRISPTPSLDVSLPVDKDGRPLAPTNLQAKSAVVIDEATGKIIFNKNGGQATPLASLTKIVAVRTFLQANPDVNRVVAYKVQDENYNYKYCPKSQVARLKVKAGETLTIKALIESSLISSTNNTVETLVRVSGLSRPAFIAKMNANAKAWGALNTHFVEPTGLSSANVSSAKDYAIITKAVYQNKLMAQISAIASTHIATVNTKKVHLLNNTSLLVQTAAFNIVGSKTGFINQAGNCLMTRITTPDGHNLIAVAMNAPTRQAAATDTKAILAYAIGQVDAPKVAGIKITK